MAKQRKHHRKIKQQRFNPVQSAGVAQHEKEMESSETSTVGSANIAYVRHDLLTTLITTVVLIIILIVASFLNAKYHWTLNFGSMLYRWLHIR